MPLTLPALPYPADALEPLMSAETFSFHHGKHHKTYVDNVNAMLEGQPLADEPLERIVAVAHETKNAKLFNNAAQVWNHTFFWNSMQPPSSSALADQPQLNALITRDFGDVAAFLAAFKAEALGHFGAGWAWLVLQDGKLVITSYHDADTPIVRPGVTPLLTADVWEHAYYIDYRNARAGFIDAFLDKLANWAFAEQNLVAAL